MSVIAFYGRELFTIGGSDGQSLSGDTTTTFVVTAPLTDQVPKCSPVLMVRDLKLCTEEDLWQL